MATLVSIIDKFNAPWQWGQKDCIALMFEVVNSTLGTSYNRDDYIPSNLNYKNACSWVRTNFDHPLVPYRKFLEDDAGMVRCYKGGDIILVFGGSPIRSSQGNQVYPIDPVPGIIFRTEVGEHYAMLSDGVGKVAFYPDIVREVVRYKFKW